MHHINLFVILNQFGLCNGLSKRTSTQNGLERRASIASITSHDSFYSAGGDSDVSDARSHFSALSLLSEAYSEAPYNEYLQREITIEHLKTIETALREVDEDNDSRVHFAEFESCMDELNLLTYSKIIDKKLLEKMFNFD